MNDANPPSLEYARQSTPRPRVRMGWRDVDAGDVTFLSLFAVAIVLIVAAFRGE